MVFYPVAVQLLIHHLGRDTDRRLGHHDLALWHGRQRRQDLSDPFRQHCPPHDAVRHVRPQGDAPLHQFFHRKPKPVHPVHSVQNRRGIGAASCHPGRHRDMLRQRDLYSCMDVKLIHQKPGGPVCQIIFINGQIKQIGADLYSRLFFLFHDDLVIQIDRLHDHPHIMIAVWPFAQHIQSEIDFSQCF